MAGSPGLEYEHVYGECEEQTCCYVVPKPTKPDVKVHERRDRPLNIHLAATWHLLQPQVGVVGRVGFIRIKHSSLSLDTLKDMNGLGATAQR